MPQAPETNDTLKCTCCSATTNGRNLVVCIDGTSNQFNTKNTNVVELYSRLRKDENQLTYYNSGIGTYARQSWVSWSYIKQIVVNKIDLAIAWRFTRILLDAYRWLSEVYKPGDRIFLFGFSRGAYQVRVLSAMIEKVGLIHRGNAAQIPFAYELYAHCNDKEHGQSVTSDKMAENFKSTFSRPKVKIHFVGAWDTVSSVGLVRADENLPLTSTGMKHVCYFRHALALDERRVKFLPEYARGGESFDPGSENDTDSSMPLVKEVWFAGTHSDIGGGNSVNTDLNSLGPALRWMMHEAAFAGLSVMRSKTKWSEVTDKSKTSKKVHESLTGLWWMLEYLPIKHLSYKDQTAVTRWPHLAAPRRIVQGQLVHKSVQGMIEKRYEPKAQRRDDSESKGFDYEPEHPESISALITLIFDNKGDLSVFLLRALDNYYYASTASWRYSANELDSTLSTLDRLPKPETAEVSQALRLIIYILTLIGQGVVKKRPVSKMPSVVNETLLRSSSSGDQFGDDHFNETVSEFLKLFCTGEILCICDAKGDCAVYSPDGRRIISGSHDSHTVRIWDAKTGDPLGAPLTGHTNRVRSLAVSSDGKRAISGSDDHTICIWDIESGESGTKFLGPLKGHTGPVVCVVFSPDDKYFTSGSEDNTVRVWDVLTGKAVCTYEGHNGWVNSVAFFPDRGEQQIISGSQDGMIHTWDAATGKTRWAKHAVASSVVPSPDGSKIALCSAGDNTVCIWDAKMSQTPLSLEGHTSRVMNVAFSPDSSRIVSGSDDKTIRIWNAKTGDALSEPLTGHEGGVRSVEYSPDGKRIVSSSSDGTIRIWNATGEWGAE